MKLHFKKIGEGKPFVILHGLFGSGDNWATFARGLSQQGYAVYLVDLRNHGHSPWSDEHSYKVMAGDVHEFILAEQLHKPVVLGHSMGGKTAMQLAVDHEGEAAGLIVVDIAPHYYPVHHQQILNGLNALDFNKIKTRSEAEKELSLYIDDAGNRQFLLKNLYWKESDKLAWRFNLDVLSNEIESVGQAIETEATIDLPVLFIKGERSEYINVGDTSMKQLFPNADLVVIKNAGHWVQADQPAETMSIILKWLSQISD